MSITDNKSERSVVNAIALAKQPAAHDAADKAFRSQRKRLLDFIRQRVRTEEDAEDILSDVFYQLMASYSVTEPIEKMTSWLFTVARNKIIDWYRKKRPESLPRSENDPALPLNLEDILYDPTQNPDQVYARSLVWTELADALDELPNEQKEVFVMHELEGKSFKEIAEATGEPINTLLSRKRYAVLFLREKLQEMYDEFEFNG
ncbi:MAG: RNA polymerase sigma factor [Bacteroidota bacterium]